MNAAESTAPGACEVLIGMAGARRHGCVAVWCDGAMRGACEVERVTRTRGEPLPHATLPTAALAALETVPDDCQRLVISEPEIRAPSGLAAVRLDHHQAHAAMAYLTSPFERTLVVVCDTRPPGVSVWLGDETTVTQVDRPWVGPSFAQLYSAAAEAIGLVGPGRERAMEALARGWPPLGLEHVARLWRFGGDRLLRRKDWRRCLATWAASANGSRKRLAGLAAAVQQHLGSLFLDLLVDLRRSIDIDTVCLGGGLFHNTYINTLVHQSGPFARTFVPVNPGNAGLAVGNALAAAAHDTGRRPAAPPTAFIGPGFSCEEIKAVLDNCKLTYQYMYEGQLIEEIVGHLRRGHLVGWFQGRMEWGRRALGHRSILANPLASHALENLNVYLKRRGWRQSFSVSVLGEQLDRYFVGPPESRHMEYDYALLDPELLRAVVPDGVAALRVHSVNGSPGLFRRLLQAWSDATGVGMLVNTSFNGFSEPMVCTPRDAVRVFYGSNLDLLVIGRFVLRK